MSLLLTADDWRAVGTDAELLSIARGAGVLTPDAHDLNAALTRADYVRLLLTMSGYGEAAAYSDLYVCGFADDADIDPADFGYVAIAKAMGIARPDADNRFRPNAPLTRADALDILRLFLVREG